MLATGSQLGRRHGRARLGRRREAKDFEGLDVKGKIVVTSGSAGPVHDIACQQKGAEGVISFSSPRPLFDPLIIPWGGIGGSEECRPSSPSVLPPREGVILRDRLKRGEKITVRAMVEAAIRKYELQDVVTASIPGPSPMPEEIILTPTSSRAYVMQGANDNYSGCAAILEAARTIQTLVPTAACRGPSGRSASSGRPEFGGTGAYVKANPEQMRRTLCNINLDMVGVRLSEKPGLLLLHADDLRESPLPQRRHGKRFPLRRRDQPVLRHERHVRGVQ